MSHSSDFSHIEMVLDWHSWLDYEHLSGLDSHLSRVYHALATQTRFALLVPNLETDTVPALATLNAAQLHSIVLKIQEPDSDEIRTAFFIHNIFDVPNYSETLRDVSRANADAPYLAPDERDKLRVFHVPEAEHNRFEPGNLRPNHLRRMLTLMTRRKISRVETGMFDANPLMTRCLYQQVGLISDVPFHLLRTAWRRLGDTPLLRERVREEYGDHLACETEENTLNG